MACAFILLCRHLLCILGYTICLSLSCRTVAVDVRILHVGQNVLSRINCEGTFHGLQPGQCCLLVLRAELPRGQLDSVSSAAWCWLGAVHRELDRVLGVEDMLQADAVLTCGWDWVGRISRSARRAAILRWWWSPPLLLCRWLGARIMRCYSSLLLSWM